MSIVPAFDSLGYFETLTEAGFTEKQARAQVEAMQGFVKSYDEATRKELATKADLRETELRLQKEIEIIRTDMKGLEIRLLKWQIGGWIALAAIMAKGFGWLGF